MSSMATINPDVRAQRLVASYVRAGYTPVEPPVLQPAEPFLDLSGEDIRRRMFLTTDPHGRELCLRPDLTIPVSRAYLQSPAAGRAAGFCYHGTVFRHREGPTAEFVQAGIESFGRQDKAAADAEMLALGLEASTLYELTSPEVRIGDIGLFTAFVAALDLAPAWKRRLVKDFNRKWSLAHDLDRLSLAGANRPPEYQGVLAALAVRIRRPRIIWSPICFRSPASRRSAAGRSAKSPSGFWNSRRSAPAPGCRAKRGR